MSPLRRRKGQSSRARSRRQQLVERERLQYDRGQPPEQPEPERRAEPGAETRASRRAGRRPARRAARRARLGSLRDASSSGLRATARRTGPGIGRLLGAVGGGLGWLFSWALLLAGLVERAVTFIFDAFVNTVDGSLDFAERRLTPDRVVVGVIGAAAACLGLSQFVAYRGVEVGQPQYSAVSSIAPPPQTDRIDAGAAHAYVLLPLAILAVAAAAMALVTGRWRLARVVSAIGLLGIAVSLAIDLPKGLDAGTAGTAFAGAHATMTEGFYAQLAASATLVLCGWVLSTSLRERAGAVRHPRSARGRGPRLRRAPSVAGGGA